VLGVDDFAFRKGRHYGTVLIDMASHRPIELFDGRDGADLAAWLRAHPEVAVICRDRSGGYGEGARQGAPGAMQVADRFHLWQNLGQAVEKTVNAYRANLGEPAPGPPAQTPPAVVQPAVEKKIITRMREHYNAVTQLHAQGLSKAAIGRKLGLHQATVRDRSHAPRPPKPPSVRQVTSWIMTHPDDLDPRDAAKLRAIRDRDAGLDRLTRHVRAFAAMMTGRHGDRLEAWITSAEHDTLTPLAGFARPPAPRPRRRPPRPEPALQLRPGRRQHQPAQNAQTPDVRPSQPGAAPKTRPPGPLTHPHNQRQNQDPRRRGREPAGLPGHRHRLRRR
jgi:DNA-binding NarL/FixJ family response regulator